MGKRVVKRFRDRPARRRRPKPTLDTGHDDELDSPDIFREILGDTDEREWPRADVLRASNVAVRTASAQGDANGGRPRKNYFTMYYDWIRDYEGLSLAAGLLYAQLLRINQRDRTGKVRPRQETLARGLRGVFTRQVRRYLDELEDAGFLLRQRRGRNRSAEYTLLVDNYGTEVSR